MKINTLKGLNEKQKAFVREYSVSWNATQAYMKIYNVNEDVARAASSRALANVNIQRYLNYCKTHVEELSNISKIMVISELKKIAFSNLADMHEDWITLKEFNSLSDGQKACIQTTETETRTEIKNGSPIKVKYVKIKLYGKQAALESIAKMMNYYQPKGIDITVSTNNLDMVSTQELLVRVRAIKQLNEENE